jgi:polyisoprenoid-binding protein YceI
MCLVCSAWSAPLVAANLALDVASSRVRFHLHALGWWPIRGEASAVGRVVVADADTRIDVHVPLDSLRMDREGYREWALSPEFFAAARHPQLHFRADAIPRSRLRDGGEISGWLEVRGQRRQARFILVASDCTAAAPTCRVRASGELSRRAFGMRTRRLTLGDRIRIDLDLHLVPAR